MSDKYFCAIVTGKGKAGAASGLPIRRLCCRRVLGEGVSCGALPLGAVRAGSLCTRPYVDGGRDTTRKQAKDPGQKYHLLFEPVLM